LKIRLIFAVIFRLRNFLEPENHGGYQAEPKQQPVQDFLPYLLDSVSSPDEGILPITMTENPPSLGEHRHTLTHELLLQLRAA
jgi:hypothetical protein